MKQRAVQPSRALLDRTRITLYGLCTSLACACAQLPPPLPPLHAVPNAENSYLAGVAEADITPPLHLSLFGHGPESRIATGVRLRLRCEVFVVAAGGDIVALVPCDLQSPSLALQRAVAQRLRAQAIPIGPDRLFLMATHTHAGPAHYFEARRYSGPFSSLAPGFDPQVVDFLAGRIADAVQRAYAALTPACLGWAAREVHGLTFNRSYVPFLANPPLPATTPSALRSTDPLLRARRAEQARAGQLPVAPSPDAAPRAIEPSGPEAAVDPTLFALRIDRRASAARDCAGSTPMGVFAVYGMHPTGVPNTNSLYHGDIFGFAVRSAEGQLAQLLTPGSAASAASPDPWARESARPGAPRVLVGLANGVEGDVSPKLDFQSVPEARKLGHRLGLEIAALASDPALQPQPQGPLRHLSWDLDFVRGHYDDAGHTLCPQAELGTAAAGGARDGPTRLRVIPEANAGFKPDQPAGCHGFKLPVRNGDPSPYDFPRVAPIALIQIGRGVLASVPGEPTTMTGYRLRSALAASLSAEPALVLPIVGLTNQYLQYFASEAEYDYQFYEGASTLYGPHSAQFLQRHIACLAEELAGHAMRCRDQGPRNVPAPSDWDPSPRIARWPAVSPPPVLPSTPLPIAARSREGVMGWELELPALSPTSVADRSALWVAVVSADAPDRSYDDDRGASLELRELPDGRWRVRFIPDLVPADARCAGRFRLLISGQVHAASEAFGLQQAPECQSVPEAAP